MEPLNIKKIFIILNVLYLNKDKKQFKKQSMKKITLIIMILGILIIANAQTENDNSWYRYNGRRAIQEQIRAEQYQEFLAKTCDTLELQAGIENYNKTKFNQNLWDIWDCNCPEVFDFALDLINTSSDGDARKLAIEMLGYRRYPDAIPLLLNHIKKDISPKEKIAIGRALAFLDRKTEALNILDCNCYNMDGMDYDCVDTYFYFFDQSIAIKYFEYYFNKPETQLKAACWLAICGIDDKTFPLFVEYLENNTTYERETVYSLVGLAAIGTEEAIEIIKKCTMKDRTLSSDTAARILDRIMEERREK
jgi:hypothetical protein